MYPPINTAITAAGYVPVTLPLGLSCAAFSLWTEDGSAWYYATDSAGSDGILVTSDGVAGLPLTLSITVPRSLSGAIAGTIICYAKGTASTNLVGLISK